MASLIILLIVIGAFCALLTTLILIETSIKRVGQWRSWRQTPHERRVRELRGEAELQRLVDEAHALTESNRRAS